MKKNNQSVKAVVTRPPTIPATTANQTDRFDSARHTKKHDHECHIPSRRKPRGKIRISRQPTINEAPDESPKPGSHGFVSRLSSDRIVAKKMGHERARCASHHYQDGKVAAQHDRH